MKLRFVQSTQTNPHLNVAVENYLLSLPETDVVTLYLWRNHRTVVVGMNQNPYAECNVEALLADGGYVMRRRTGGGAVYHDAGNINFSFVVPKALYDQARQFAVLRRAVASYGLQAEVSGRNDVLCDGRKFSGNAFSKGTHQNLHHGTILINGNMDDLQRYLRVKPSKLKKHGIASVQSRVVNLAELAPVTSVNIVPRLVAAFESEYGSKVEETSFDELCRLPEVQRLYDEFASDAWLFAKWRNFEAQMTQQFDWGHVELSLSVDQEHGRIVQVSIASDALEPDLVREAETLLTGASTVDRPSTDGLAHADMLDDILNLIY
ncbi:MAG: lipoate--protein ligase [Bacteroidales bacterium]|nr:lipoate--protein ligase [Bacteroidales bacterium]